MLGICVWKSRYVWVEIGTLFYNFNATAINRCKLHDTIFATFNSEISKEQAGEQTADKIKVALMHVHFQTPKREINGWCSVKRLLR